MSEQIMTRTLYDRLGGEQGIRAIVRDVLDNHMNNPIVSVRYGKADLEKVYKYAVEFFCAGTGGPQQYTGRDMLTVHRGMNVSEQEFVEVLDDILAALDKNDIDHDTRTEVLGVLYSMKNEIVRV